MSTAHSRPALRLAATPGVDLGAAIDAFLSQPDLAATTRAKYRQTLAVVEDELGDGPVTGPGLAGSLSSAGITRRRRRGTATSRPSDRSRYCTRTRILEIDGDVELQRRAEKHDHTPKHALGKPRAGAASSSSSFLSCRVSACSIGEVPQVGAVRHRRN